MQQLIEQAHNTDDDGRPAGGFARGTGIEIEWQNGPLAWVQGDTAGGRLEPNGAFVEGVIAAALGRLEYYQSTPFRCRENALAITKLEEALLWLGKRTADRIARGVEGTHEL